MFLKVGGGIVFVMGCLIGFRYRFLVIKMLKSSNLKDQRYYRKKARRIFIQWPLIMVFSMLILWLLNKVLN